MIFMLEYTSCSYCCQIDFAVRVALMLPVLLRMPVFAVGMPHVASFADMSRVYSKKRKVKEFSALILCRLRNYQIEIYDFTADIYEMFYKQIYRMCL